MSAQVLLNVLNDLGKKIRCEAMPSMWSVFPNEYNKFSNTGAWMQDSIYHILLSNFAVKHHDFTIRKRDFFMDVNA